MQRLAVQRVLGLLLMLFSFTMLPPAAVGLFYGDGAIMPFIDAFALTIGSGVLLWWPARKFRAEMRLRDGFLVVALMWTVLGLFGAIPLVLGTQPQLDIAGAIFESVSGLTTTGGTVIVGIDKLPHSILYYRMQLHFLGGMGIIVLAVAILPMLGIGGMQMFRAETPGPMKDSKLTPRITETAKSLWYIYLGLTAVCALAYWLAGMSLFDAIMHAFSVVSTGGFSTHDDSIMYFKSATIEWITVFFMFVGALNFATHFMAWRQWSLRTYWQDSELRAFFLLLFLASAIVGVALLQFGTYADPMTSLRHTTFTVVSMATSTGLTVAPHWEWPSFIPILMLLLSFIGGCAGSTSGGMKVVRVMLLLQQGMREVTRLIHPSAQIPVRVGGRVVSDRVIEAVWGFFSLYVASYIILSLLVTATGLDLVTAFSAVAACMNNVGPGLAGVGATFANISDAAQLLLSFAMLLGRLEVFTILVLFSPRFWRH